MVILPTKKKMPNLTIILGSWEGSLKQTQWFSILISRPNKCPFKKINIKKCNKIKKSDSWTIQAASFKRWTLNCVQFLVYGFIATWWEIKRIQLEEIVPTIQNPAKLSEYPHCLNFPLFFVMRSVRGRSNH